MREVVKLQPVKFAAIELVADTSTHVPERLGGHMKDGVPTGGIPIPDLASFLTGFSADTKIVGMNAVPPGDRPPATIVHLAFDVMVGAASALSLLAALVRVRLVAAARPAALAAGFSAPRSPPPRSRCWRWRPDGSRPRSAASPGSSTVSLRTAEAVTRAPGIWGSFAVVVALYTVVGAGLVLVLRADGPPLAQGGRRAAARALRAARAAGASDRRVAPTVPRRHEHGRRRDSLVRRHLLRGPRRRRLRRRVLGSDRRRREARGAAARADRPGDGARSGRRTTSG